MMSDTDKYSGDPISWKKEQLLRWGIIPGLEYVNVGGVLRPKEATLDAIENTKLIATASGLWLDLDNETFVETVTSFNMIRFNLSHVRDDETREKTIKVLQRLEELDLDIPVIWDLQWPETRTLKNQEAHDLEIHAGDKIQLIIDESGERQNTTNAARVHMIYLNRGELLNSLEVGWEVTIDDGKGGFEVKEIYKDGALLIANNSFDLGSRKSMNFRGTVEMDTISGTDRSDIDMLINPSMRNGDIIAPSFVKSGADLRDLSELVSKEFGRYALMPKIECRQAMNNLRGIIQLAKYICAARGDGRMEIGENPAEGLIQLEEMLTQASIEWVQTVIATGIIETMNGRYAPQTADLDAIAAHLMKLQVDFLWFSSETVRGTGALRVAHTIADAKKARMKYILDAKTVRPF